MMNEINPTETTRACAFELWMKAPMPMVTFFKTLDVTNLLHVSKERGLKFNMLMCWCIGKAATQVKEFYMLPVGDRLIKRLFKNKSEFWASVFLSENLLSCRSIAGYVTKARKGLGKKQTG